MNRSLWLGLIFILAFCRGSFSQNVDSLMRAIASKHDTTKCNILRTYIDNEYNDTVWTKYNAILISICESNLEKAKSSAEKKFYLKNLAVALGNEGERAARENDINKAKDYFLRRLSIHEKLNDKQGIGATLNSLGYAYQTVGDIAAATEEFRRALQIFEEIKDKEGMGYSLNYLGLVYDQTGNKPLAFEYYFKSLKLKEEINDEWGVAQTLNNLGLLYNEQGDFKKALEYCFRSLEIRTKLKNKKGIAHTLHFLGLIYYNQDSLVKAEEYYLKSLKIREEISDVNGMAYTLQNLGVLYSYQENYSKAIKYLQKSYSLYEQSLDKSGMAYCLQNISDILYTENKIKEGLELAEKSLELARGIGYPDNISRASSLLSQYYSGSGNWKKAYEMQLLFKQMTDSINNETNRKASIQKSFQYSYEKKAAADSIKTTEERKVHAAQIKEERTQRFALYGGLILVILFSIFMFNRFRITQKQKVIIENQKQEVDHAYEKLNEKNKEVLDSIHYAKRIQSALITNEKSVESQLLRLKKIN